MFLISDGDNKYIAQPYFEEPSLVLLFLLEKSGAYITLPGPFALFEINSLFNIFVLELIPNTAPPAPFDESFSVAVLFFNIDLYKSKLDPTANIAPP